MTTRTRVAVFPGWLLERESRPDLAGAQPTQLLEQTARLPGLFRLALVGGGVDLLGEVREDSSTASRTIEDDAVTGALESIGLPFKRRDSCWLIPPGGQRPCEINLTPVGDSVRIESVLSTWDEIGTDEREALARFLCRAQGSVRFARCELGERQAVIAARLQASVLEAGLPHAAAAVLAGSRLLGREVGALLDQEVAEGYLRFFGVDRESRAIAGRI
jgi:hypothetical protein